MCAVTECKWTVELLTSFGPLISVKTRFFDSRSPPHFHVNRLGDSITGPKFENQRSKNEKKKEKKLHQLGPTKLTLINQAMLNRFNGCDGKISSVLRLNIHYSRRQSRHWHRKHWLEIQFKPHVSYNDWADQRCILSSLGPKPEERVFITDGSVFLWLFLLGPAHMGNGHMVRLRLWRRIRLSTFRSSWKNDTEAQINT